MTLESLEKLRDGYFADLMSSNLCSAKDLADEIQAEVHEKYIARDDVERCYFRRPLYEGGEPVQFGDQVSDGDFWMESPVDTFSYKADGSVDIWGDGNCMSFQPDDVIMRPPEPDTQEKIDNDYHSMKINLFQAASIGAVDRDEARKIIERFDRLMRRQRELDGVDDGFLRIKNR